MAVVQNVVRLQGKMKKILAQYTSAEVEVGFTAAYALPVHERVEMKWKGLPRDGSVRYGGGSSNENTRWVYVPKVNAKPPKPKPKKTKARRAKGFFWDPQGRAQAKFLEAPAKYLRPELSTIVARGLKAGKTMLVSLLAAGYRLQREAQKLVPVDTGNLKNSAFTRGKEI